MTHQDVAYHSICGYSGLFRWRDASKSSRTLPCCSRYQSECPARVTSHSTNFRQRSRVTNESYETNPTNSLGETFRETTISRFRIKRALSISRTHDRRGFVLPGEDHDLSKLHPRVESFLEVNFLHSVVPRWKRMHLELKADAQIYGDCSFVAGNPEWHSH